MSAKKQPTEAQKKALDELHTVLKKHNIASAQVSFQGDKLCWDGQEWVHC
jgi:hypothetical protein